MTKERIQILVDNSRDTGWSGGLIRIEPDNIYQTTNNRDYLSRGEVTLQKSAEIPKQRPSSKNPLQNYDVLTICSNTSLKYTDAERQLIREFVENGGGLLLATSTSRFERDVREPISELGINGSEHQASLLIRDGEIHVSAEVSEDTGICLSTDDDTITRFILGVITPYAAYSQNQLHITPTVNSSVQGLLGTLFPKH